MQKIIYLLLFIALGGFSAFSQNLNNPLVKQRLGLGYFGQTLTYPGLVLEYEREWCFGEKASLPLRIDLVGYNHARNHFGLMADAHIGFRRSYTSGFFLEESIGIGFREAFINSEEVLTLDDNGELVNDDRLTPVDFTPSVSLGLGYRFGNNEGPEHSIWMRPKFYWQYPAKASAITNLALQVGYSIRLQ